MGSHQGCHSSQENPPKKKWEEWEEFFLIKDNVYTAIYNNFSSVQPFLAYQKSIIIESIHLKH